jgi:Domain of unknown function (DUF4177)
VGDLPRIAVGSSELFAGHEANKSTTGTCDAPVAAPYPVVVQRWEYKVVSLREGRYTETLNEYGRDGWELVAVTPQPLEPPSPERGATLPIPRPFGRLEDAAAKLSKLGEAAEAHAGTAATALLWVLRRPLSDD